MSYTGNVQPLQHRRRGERAIRHVFIRNLELLAQIGVHGHEKGKLQPVRINVDLAVEDAAVIEDKLDQVVDYGAITRKIRGLVGKGHINLAETMAERIAALCFEDARVKSARVRVEKLEALKNAESASIEDAAQKSVAAATAVRTAAVGTIRERTAATKSRRAVFVLAALAACAFGWPARAESITGAGASFPYPVYAKWAGAYRNAGGSIAHNYESIGSGGGVAQIKANTVTFGASDAPLRPWRSQQSRPHRVPHRVGGVVPVVNLPGVAAGRIVLDGKTLAAVFMGRIGRWNDPAIKALNPGVNLPSLPILIVHRSDASGTSFVFASYLSRVSGEWKSKVGAATSSTGPSAWARRATKASRSASHAPPVRSAMSSSPMPSRTASARPV